MITITAELLNGTIRANEGGSVAGANDRRLPEWPPSPARLFAALVSGGGTGEHNRIGTDDEELRKLERATPPLIAASSLDSAPASRLQDRFVVLDTKHKNRVQEYPARKAGLVRPGDRTAPRSPYVTYCWPELELTEQEELALRRRAARVGYLGCADSPVRLGINQESPIDDRLMWRPDDDGTAPISVPYPGYLGVLDRAFEEFRGGGSPRAAGIRRVRVAYRDPQEPVMSGSATSTIWLSLDRSVGYRRVLHVGEALRGALLSSFDSSGFGTPPPLLHGHGIEPGSQHARFLPLPNVGNEYARGQIMGAAIWLPADTDPDLVEAVRVAIARVQNLHLKGGRSIGVELRDPGAVRPWTTNPRRWTTESNVFVSAFPVVHERFGKLTAANAVEVIGAWCENAGLPRPIEAMAQKPSFFDGLPRLAARDVRRSNSESYPFSNVWIRFDKTLVGPLAIGRGRSFGLGLLVPAPDSDQVDDNAKESSDDA